MLTLGTKKIIKNLSYNKFQFFTLGGKTNDVVVCRECS